jgi:hypothetical protein
MRHNNRTAQWANGTAHRYSETVGPRHDSYGRDIVDLTIKGLDYKITSCGLAGEFLTLPDRTEIHLAEPQMWLGADDRKAQRHRCRANYEAEVVRHTGFESQFWLDTLWGKIELARYKRDPAAYHLQQAINDIDDCMMGYAE